MLNIRGDTTCSMRKSDINTDNHWDMGAACYARMSPVPVSAAIGHWLWVAGPMLTGAQWTSHSAALIGQNISQGEQRGETWERGIVPGRSVISWVRCNHIEIPNLWISS